MPGGGAYMNMRSKVTITAPATTANLGPGFDCLGMALDFHNTVSVSHSERFAITISGEGEAVLSRDKNNLVYQATTRLFDEAGQTVPEIEIDCHNQIPLARGLGSSSSAITAGLLAANALLGNKMSLEELLPIAVEIEGHADNLAPAFFGGCQIVVRDASRLVHEEVPVKDLWKCVLFIPDFEMHTLKARNLLLRHLPREDAVYNIGRVALLTKALITGQADSLKIATQDRLHQPQRQTLFPAMDRIFTAALDAGADGAFLSGAGSTIAALARRSLDAIGQAMLAEGNRAGIRGRLTIAGLSKSGAQVLEE